MENGYSIYTYNQGPEGVYSHLPFRLDTPSTKAGLGELLLQEKFYFSLQAAASDLILEGLTSRLHSINELPEKFNLLGTVTDIFTGSRVLSLDAYGPTGNRPRIAPGIYLNCGYDVDFFGMLSGMPVPNSDQNGHGRCVLLAHLEEGALKTTEWYQQLHQYAVADVTARASLQQDFPYQLSFKGNNIKLAEDGHTKLPVKQFVEHHYFSTLRGGLSQLMRTNLYRFDQHCPDNRNTVLYQHAYINHLDEDRLAHIFVVPIGTNCPAGIYLSSGLSIGGLEEESGIDLFKLAQYDPQSDNIRLASYTYREKYALDAPFHISGISATALRQDETTEAQGTDYVVRIEYIPNATDQMQYVVREANDFYHCDSVEGAVLTLLDLHAQLFLDVPVATDMGYHITKACIQHKDGSLIAQMQVQDCVKRMELAQYTHTTEEHRPELSLVLYENSLVPKLLWEFASAIAVTNPAHVARQNVRIVALSSVDDNYHMQPLAGRELLTTFVTGKQPNQHVKREGQEIESPVFRIKQGWTGLTPHDRDIQYRGMLFFDFDTAVAVFDAFKPEHFSTVRPNAEESALREIILEDDTKQIEIGRSFRLQETVGNLPPGMYLQFNLLHPDGLRRALAHENMTVMPSVNGSMSITFQVTESFIDQSFQQANDRPLDRPRSLGL
ncbi:hypothetical protein [Chitinophaga rhizosphaerae]|uniref:hypothetical protein n=1 Tax=Chitinophaga rhizosphaerae TaxID=1864947 RepID=UPI000F815192|nr:hypothetical protein [Chitinophaga rhizosphaerae]